MWIAEFEYDSMVNEKKKKKIWFCVFKTDG